MHPAWMGVQELCLHKRSVPDMDWTPDNLMLASVAEDGGVCLWQVDTGQLVWPPP